MVVRAHPIERISGDNMKPILYCLGCICEASEKLIATIGDFIDGVIDGCLDCLDECLEWVEAHLNEN